MPETVSSEPNKTMGYRAGEEKDLEGIMAVIHDAQRTMGEAGLDQWQDGYPSEEIIRDDMQKWREQSLGGGWNDPRHRYAFFPGRT
mgnify:CR=1 FL=1